ncbi:MAG: PAS domain-containing protein [Rhodocyclaceae bacterium]|nr:PAS domain-containing protein [Rhodocyclaceae bacterium]
MVDSALRAAAMPAPDTHFGALVIDGRGVIVRCSDAAPQLFGGEPGDLEGKMISAFVTNLMPSDAAPSYHARYMAYLSNSGLWRRFQAVDVHGRRFPIEIAMSRLAAEGRQLLRLDLRLPAAAD